MLQISKFVKNNQRWGARLLYFYSYEFQCFTISGYCQSLRIRCLLKAHRQNTLKQFQEIIKHTYDDPTRVIQLRLETV